VTRHEVDESVVIAVSIYMVDVQRITATANTEDRFITDSAVPGRLWKVSAEEKAAK
jgi:hypothetical protein